jgi:hypothetical protein
MQPSGTWIDIGNDFAIRFTSWHMHDRAGIEFRHTKPNGTEHITNLCFDLDGIRQHFRGRYCWKVISFEPLSLHPSLHCSCGTHGWITEGKWIPV